MVSASATVIRHRCRGGGDTRRAEAGRHAGVQVHVAVQLVGARQVPVDLALAFADAGRADLTLVCSGAEVLLVVGVAQAAAQVKSSLTVGHRTEGGPGLVLLVLTRREVCAWVVLLKLSLPPVASSSK
jgi:hypothetical protein